MTFLTTIPDGTEIAQICACYETCGCGALASALRRRQLTCGTSGITRMLCPLSLEKRTAPDSLAQRFQRTRESRFIIVPSPMLSGADMNSSSKDRCNPWMMVSEQEELTSGPEEACADPSSRSASEMGGIEFDLTERMTARPSVVSAEAAWPFARGSYLLPGGLRVIEPEPIPQPRLPEGIPDEEGESVGALVAVLLAYYQTVPSRLQARYARQVMRAAGETAGMLIRQATDN